MIETDLAAEVQSDAPLGAPRGGRLSRRVRHFPISPRVDIRPDERGAYQVAVDVAADRPGLLYGVARILARNHINLQMAKITTLGERVEKDLFVDGPALQQNREQIAIETELLEAIAP